MTWAKLVQVAKRLTLTFAKLAKWLKPIDQSYQQWLVVFMIFTISEREIERKRRRERVDSYIRKFGHS